jgi:hypothetical protein
MLRPVWKLPAREELTGLLSQPEQTRLLDQADEIVAGRVRLFGGQAVPLHLASPGDPAHWTVYEQQGPAAPMGEARDGKDIKFTWEPGRFGWAYTLGRAYHLSGQERYAAAFWRYAAVFLQANPPYLGAHWMSAQEVALRLIAFTFALQVFGPSGESTAGRRLELARAIAAHAARIPPTLMYARAQNNNHLLNEAAGLYTAGCALAGHPQSARWRRLGWHEFQRGIQAQIAPDGAYGQHSANYQRLMLQLATWMAGLAERQGQALATKSQQRLAAATAWLLAVADPASGQVPNLGPNDGAYIFPLTVEPFEDHRPVLQAAGIAFLGARPFPQGSRDEIALWLRGSAAGLPVYANSPATRLGSRPDTPHVLCSPDGRAWAYLRAAHFSGRPGHADQLHLDLWWRGLNIAQDAGTYLYNAPPPWDNALARSGVHNTVVVDELDQMTPAGRFLFLHWAQAQVVRGEQAADGAWRSLVARHNGYRRLGLIHQRAVAVVDGGKWAIEDHLLPTSTARAAIEPHSACLHWLLPDWEWQIETPAQNGPAATEEPLPVCTLQLRSPHGWVSLQVSAGLPPGAAPQVQLARAGQQIAGEGQVSPTWGWRSATYGDKIAALSLRVWLRGALPLSFTSRWSFPQG